MRRVSLASVAVVLTILLLAGVALARTVECRPNEPCLGTEENDRLIGTDGSEDMRGYAGNDVLRGRGGLDNLQGGVGTDILKGGADGDTYFFEPNWGKETIEDTPVGGGIDTGNYAHFDFVRGDLTINLNSKAGPEAKNASRTSTLNWDNNLIDVVVDGEGNDTIIGRNVRDGLQASNGGVDTINANGGDDFVYARDSSGAEVDGDQIDCGNGNDMVAMDPADTAVNCERVES